MNHRLSILALASSLMCAGAMSAPADAAVVVTVEGNRARADITLGGTPDNPQYSGTLYLTFDSPTGLTAQNLDISAQVVDPGDAAVTGRLPAHAAVPAQFPVMVSVRPRNELEFRNAVQVEMYTTGLNYTANSNYRLYKAPAGQPFNNLTEDVLPGSVRIRARTGGFSDFLVVTDTGTSLEAAQSLFTAMFQQVADDDIEDATGAQLKLDLDETYEEFREGDYDDARSELDEMELRVQGGAGTTVPNRWRAQGDLTNVTGDLHGAAAALDFQLRKLAAASSTGNDDDDSDEKDDD